MSDRLTQHYCAAVMAVDSAADDTAAVQAAAAGLRDLLQSDLSAVVLFDLQTGSIVTTSPEVPKGPPPFISAQTPLLNRLVRERRTLVVPSAVEQPDLEALLWSEQSDVRALIIAPIGMQERVVGVVSVECYQTRVWQAGEVMLVEAIAAQLAQRLERVRLREALERRTEELSAIGHTALTISSQLELQTTLHNILEQATRLTRADAGLLSLCDEARAELEVVVSYRLGENYCGQRTKFGEGLAGRAALSRQIEIVQNYAVWEDRIERLSQEAFNAVIAVPLLHDDQVLGVIDLIHFTPGTAFDEIDQVVVKLFAAQAVVALTNARLYDQAHQYADRMAALARASQLLDAQGNMAASIQPLVREGMKVLGAQACLVIISKLGAPHDMYYVGISEKQAALLRQHTVPPYEQVATSGVRTIHDIRDILPAHALNQIVTEAGFNSTICLPLMREDRAIGCVSYFYTVQHVWNQDEIELARIVANQIAAMVTNAQLYHEIHEANRLKADFVSTVSHELRTPMGAIIGYTEMMLNNVYGDLPAPLMEPLNRVKSNADQLLTLINQMLDLSRIEAGRLDLLQEPYNPRDLLQSVTAIMQPLASAKALSFVAHTDEHVPQIVLGDVSRLRQILINLIGNSVKFTNQGKIEVRCSVIEGQKRRLSFAVIDTGIGIPREQFATIWEPFRQGNSSATREYGGTGLGLAIVRKLAGLMLGSVVVESTLGSGSTFTLTIPLLTPQEEYSLRQ
jgi:signal transduction histidine kinase/putative methionine-R-sulfoxide reductase with GAF domain